MSLHVLTGTQQAAHVIGYRDQKRFLDHSEPFPYEFDMTPISKTQNIYFSRHGRRYDRLGIACWGERMLQTGDSLGPAVRYLGAPTMHEFSLCHPRRTSVDVFFKQTYQSLCNHPLSAAGMKFLAVGLRAWTSCGTYTEREAHLLTVPPGRSSTSDNLATAKQRKVADTVKVSVKRWRVEHSYVLDQHEAASELIDDIANSEIARCGTSASHLWPSRQNESRHLINATRNGDHYPQSKIQGTPAEQRRNTATLQQPEDAALSYCWRNLAFHKKGSI